MEIPNAVRELIDQGALFVVNHSGGKDSQAMTIELRKHIPAAQLLLIHAELPEVDWDGIEQHIAQTAGDLPLIVCRAVKTFFQMVEKRGMFPSPTLRQCTSDLKRGPIEREIRRHLAQHPEFKGKVVNCMGLRAEESSARAKATTWKRSEKNSVAGREWFDWLPIHAMSTTQVFATIKEAGQQVHWAYLAGMSRLSCCFCVMASRADLKRAAELRPALYRRFVETEQRLGHTFLMPTKKAGKQTLEEVTGIAA